MDKQRRKKLNREVRLLRRIISLLEQYSEEAHGLEITEHHLPLYREWHEETATEILADMNLVNILRDA